MKFPTISQFRHTIRRVTDYARWAGTDEQGDPVFDRSREVPTLDVRGTVKLHGTNAGVKLDADGNLECWSRTHKITVDNDNQGFAKFVETRAPVFKSILGRSEMDLMIYGEWCGKGIQSGCAIHELDKMFVIFACRIIVDEENSIWSPPSTINSMGCPDQAVYSIYDFPTFQLDIDFENPADSQNKLIELTMAVEAECPVAKAFGVSGVGEGIVWHITGGEYNSSAYWFKVKGDKHSVTKVKKLAEVDVERIGRAIEFAEMTVTEARCLQGVSMLPEVTQKQTGTFLKWITGDILKEEHDRLGDNLTTKDVNKRISNIARDWYFKHLDSLEGL